MTGSDRGVGLDLDAIESRVSDDEAGRWVADLASGKREWRMRVPVDPHDADVVLMQAVDDRAALVAEVRRLREALGECHGGDGEPHRFEPGIDVDMVAEGRSPDPRWCNVCGETRAVSA